MANIYDWQVGPNGELINTGSPDYGAPPPAKPSWNPPDRISSGINAPSPSLLSGAGPNPNMGYPAFGMTLNTGGPDSGLDQSAPPTAAPNPGGSLDFSKLLNSFNPISSAEAATLPQKQPYGPQVPPGGLPSQQPGALMGAINNIHSGSSAALAAAHGFANRLAKTSSRLGGLWNQIGNAPGGVAAVEGGNPAVANPPGPTNPIPATALPQPDRPYRAQAPQAAAPQQAPSQQPYGSPWDPQGTGYAAAQRLAQRAPVQGPLAALGQQQNSPFTMVLRPNASAQNGNVYPGSGQSGGGGRGSGGSPLSTALDLSGYQPQQAPPPAPQSYNLGYGGAPPRPPPRPPLVSSRMRAQAPKTAAGYGDQSFLYGNQPPF